MLEKKTTAAEEFAEGGACAPAAQKSPVKKRVLALALGGLAALSLVLLQLLWRPTPPEALDYGYAREVPEDERALRQQLLDTARGWLGTEEGSAEHRQLVDLYNAQEVLPVGHMVSYEDNWCAAFVTAVALQSGLEDIIPPECGCQRQIGLFEGLGRWQEDDTYVPLPGDLIYYAWGENSRGDCRGWADHVGIVVGTAKNYIKVIEGNYQNAVVYRYIPKDDETIRGYGLPDYAAKCK